MKKLIIVLVIALSVFIFAGCASVYVKPTPFISTGTVVMNLRAEETNTVWLGMFGKGPTYPLAERVAQQNGINRIATVERYWKPGVFGLWTEYTTVVTGEGPGKEEE